VIRVRIFLAENCSHCNTMLKPLLPELMTELTSRGIAVDVIETADVLGEFGYWDPRRKLLKDYAYKVCGTPYIVVEGKDSRGEWRRRAILGVLPNKDDYRTMILFEVAKAILERYLDVEDRLAVVGKLYSRYFSDTERPDGTELYDVISDVLKLVRSWELEEMKMSF